MQLSRRKFVVTGLGLMGTTLVRPYLTGPELQPVLDQSFIESHKRMIEENILPAMEAIYLKYGEIFDETYKPGRKYDEKISGFYDYDPCGISVLAHLAATGNQRAVSLLTRIQQNTKYYQEHIHGTNADGKLGTTIRRVPLRRLLLHIALAYEKLEPYLSAGEREWYTTLIDQQVKLAIEYNKNFFPGEADLNRLQVNNHNAIFMQGIWYCGKIFKRPEWVQLTEEFAQRMYNCIHPDGYFEEHTNELHEGGPSMVYTRLTVGSVYDVLDGKNKSQEKFLKAGSFYRSFINNEYRMISIADERTNCHNFQGRDYGLALHSLTPEGRYFIVDNLKKLDYSKTGIEYLAVIYHELDLMMKGECKISENHIEGNSRISLPLGVVRKNGFTAGISALLALNRQKFQKGDYAIDQQNMVYLSHEKQGLILIGYKSKGNPQFSTFRIGDDAYTIKTGKLEMGNGWAEATLFYRTFTSKIRWEIRRKARLILTSDTDQPVSTTLTITDEKVIRTRNKYKIEFLDGFSPYTEKNIAEKIKCMIIEWNRKLVVEFICI